MLINNLIKKINQSRYYLKKKLCRINYVEKNDFVDISAYKEDVSHFKKHLYTSQVVIALYVCMQYLVGLEQNARIISSFAIFFFFFELLFLKTNQIFLSKVVYLISINISLTASILLLKENDFSFIFYLPIALVSLFLFESSSLKSKVILVLIPVVMFCISQNFKIGNVSFPERIITLNQIRYTNLIIAYSFIVVQFFYFYYFTIKQKHFKIHQSKLSTYSMIASGLAHEINNPLAIIKGKSNQLLKSKDHMDPQVNDSLNTIIKSTERIHKIVISLQSFNASASSEPPKLVMASQIASAAINLSQEKFSLNGIPLRFEIENDFMIEGNEHELVQALINIINNSFEAVANLDEKWVNVKIYGFKISIEDSGKGISKEVADKIFTTFYTTKKATRDIGIGLSLSKEIIERHCGSLSLDKESKNTRFVFKFPSSRLQSAI